jgi:hypothetical protein
VEAVAGGKGDPPDASALPEGELRHLLEIIDNVPEHGHDPRATIVAVNALHTAGREKAIAATKEYIRVSECAYTDLEEKIDVIAGLLFHLDSDDGAMNFPVRILKKTDHRARPAPVGIDLVLIGDVPFFVGHGPHFGRCVGAGIAFDRRCELGVFRPSPLSPASTLSELTRCLECWHGESGEAFDADDLRNQVAQLIDPLIRDDILESVLIQPRTSGPESRDNQSGNLRELTWDFNKAMYTVRERPRAAR